MLQNAGRWTQIFTCIGTASGFDRHPLGPWITSAFALAMQPCDPWTCRPADTFELRTGFALVVGTLRRLGSQLPTHLRICMIVQLHEATLCAEDGRSRKSLESKCY
jgi:hypothetical protein